MCLTAPARVISCDEASALVEQDGRRRVASLLLVPEVRAGDWVLVGVGTVLRRLDPAEATDLLQVFATARATRPAPAPATSPAPTQAPILPKGAIP